MQYSVKRLHFDPQKRCFFLGDKSKNPIWWVWKMAPLFNKWLVRGLVKAKAHATGQTSLGIKLFPGASRL